MNIVVIGTLAQLLGCQQKFEGVHSWKRLDSRSELESPGDVIIDFGMHTTGLSIYHQWPEAVVFLEALQGSVASRLTHRLAYGFCGWPTFLERALFEVGVPEASDGDKLRHVCAALGTEFQPVADQTGLVTPRVVSLIINEAYFAWESHTATRADIDLAMKLGTNYPYGPFEWAARIGTAHVANLLSTLLAETGHERYRASAALQAEALAG
ncbi:MAG: 3-hydroxyacyl-CoA dehydrogenase family protein [Cyclobacteriaceae bacterium]|jgi:3-hydroxybutyryl-CoA dehydrogenase|nr:3-hydroxyacyl-CoA dehydrogenase family protein [Cyclobacteriaceae bacterium]